MNELQAILNFVSNNMVAAIPVVEMALRMMPTSKPMSLLTAGAAIFHQISLIFSGVDNFLNKVIPQNLAAPASAQAPAAQTQSAQSS